MSTNTDEETHHAGDEYEDRPVPESALKDGRSFWGMYAGEHTAGTEFLIGPMFLAQWGVGGWELILGLLFGNLAAVLSWRYITAPIATGARLTLYRQLENITGRGLVSIYNLANGVLFCFLAGSMITVSATAFGPIFPGIKMPDFGTAYPTGVAWVVLVLAIGALMTFVAARGYGLVARVGQIAAPWMFLVFVACAMVTMGQIGNLNVLDAIRPIEGVEPKVGFWGVFFFAWFCNAAMHIGMGDLSVLRFARKSSYGWASAAGMYLGHCVAWLCAGILLAYWVRFQNADPATGAPLGTMINHATGMAGLICVVIAGWTTANPTLYRAGLAFQGLFPNMGRVAATVLAGVICTIAGMFPKLAMSLLSFVGIYGMILSPIGAVIFVDYWLLKKAGLQPEWAKVTGKAFHPAAFLAWVLPVAGGLFAYQAMGLVAPTYVTLPVWLATGVLYFFLSRVFAPKPAARA